MEPLLIVVTGITVLTVVGIAFGGTFLLRVATRDHGFNELQTTFFRAGHAHAGVLVTLGLAIAALTAAADADPGWSAAGSIGVLLAAIFIPAGFFLSVLGDEPERPGRMVVSIWVGAACLTVGLVIAGIVVVAAGIDAW